MSTPTSINELSGSWSIDPSHSEISFVTRHAMVTKVRGAFSDFTGTAEVPAEGISAATIEVTIKAESIDTRNADRDAHLKTNEFFDMETYPEITFHSTDIKAASADALSVTGDLTIKGSTKSVTIDFEFTGVATDPFGNLRAGFEGSLDISRADYGITWNAPLETGGVLISDKVNLQFDISAIKNS